MPDDANELNIEGNILLRSRNGDRRWIDLKIFTFRPGCTDEKLLASLIGHRQFQDGYIGVDAGENVHGPYHLTQITPACYDQVSVANALDRLEDFCRRGHGQSKVLVREINAVVRGRMAEADSLFVLRELTESRHDFAYILWEFEEVVTIRRETSELSLIVMGLD